ncbi:uncharacterized protein LOC141613431 [Silene latifolia]|uniref:uncharacterized protein LOC141613431 n=1 Tax=Silene latifolia TaxID=37657 RepID=UPI003D7851C4
MGTRRLSYAGRLVLVKAVLSSLHCYWARIFILPATVLKRVEALCRSFLWQGKEVAHSPPLIAWDTCCQTQKMGGLGIVDLRRWNVAALGKYVWWIAHKEDHLWVKWIHAIYMKHVDWFSYNPKSTASWSWRKICGVKDKLKQGYVDSWWLKQDNHYTIQQGYSWLGALMGSRFHGFILCGIVQGRLLKKDRLMNMQICQDSVCVLCGNDGEDHAHLFFGCTFSILCLQQLNNMLRTQVPDTGYVEWWTHKRFQSLFRKQVVAACLQGLVYYIWDARNRCRIEHVVPRPEKIVKLVKRL